MILSENYASDFYDHLDVNARLKRNLLAYVIFQNQIHDIDTWVVDVFDL